MIKYILLNESLSNIGFEFLAMSALKFKYSGM